MPLRRSALGSIKSRIQAAYQFKRLLLRWQKVCLTDGRQEKVNGSLDSELRGNPGPDFGIGQRKEANGPTSQEQITWCAQNEDNRTFFEGFVDETMVHMVQESTALLYTS